MRIRIKIRPKEQIVKFYDIYDTANNQYVCKMTEENIKNACTNSDGYYKTNWPEIYTEGFTLLALSVPHYNLHNNIIAKIVKREYDKNKT